MITIERHDDPPGTWALRSAYSSRLRYACKAVPGMRWDGDARVWVGYADAVNVVCRLLKKHGVIVKGRKAMLATEASTEHELPVAYKKLRDYQKEGVDFLVRHGESGVLLADEMGCIDGEAIVNCNRAKRGFKIKLKDLFYKFHGGIARDGHGKWDPSFVTSIRSLCDGEFHLNPIRDVLDKGVKPVVLLTLMSGKKLRLTPDHEVKTPRGFCRADSLSRGDLVLVNGQPKCRLCGTTKNVKAGRKFPGHCWACIQKLRVKSIPGDGRSYDDDGYVLISGMHEHPFAQKHGKVFEHRLVMEKKIGRYLRPEERVHHRNQIRDDNRIKNLELCADDSDHATHHGLEGGYLRLNGSNGKRGEVWFVPIEDKVVSVKKDGVAHVYDIVCADPHRNFVANGVVVHNCGKSAQAVRAIRAFRGKTVIVCLAQNLGVWTGNEFMESQVYKWWPLVKKEGSLCQIEGTSLPAHEWRVWRSDSDKQTKLTGPSVEKAAAALGEKIRTFQRKHGRAPALNDAQHEFRCACGAVAPFTIKGGDVPEWPSDAGCTAGLPRASNRIVVIHYDILAHWVDYLVDTWGASRVIFDEIHEVVGDRAARTKAVQRLAEACEVRIGLTGTPMDDNPKNLWRTANILSPGRFGEKFYLHGIRYCAGHQVQVTMDKVVYDFKGMSHQNELRRRLRFFMLRRLKRDVQKDLPPLIRETVDIKIPAKACINVDFNILKRSRVASQALAMSADAKFPTIIEAIKKDLRDGRKVVAFTHRKLVAEHVADACRAAGFFASVVHGDVLKHKRGRLIADVRDQPAGAVLACTMDTCGVGIDLSFASVANYVELSYEPKVILQSIDRLHRFGQKDTVIVRFYIGRGSIDDIVAQVLMHKLDNIEAIIGAGGEDLRKQLDSMPKGKEALHELYLALKARAA